MVTDHQVKQLRKLMRRENRISVAASKAGMDEKTARKYLNTDQLPSELKAPHTWRTRDDPFEPVWAEIRSSLEVNPGLEAKTLFEHLQRTHPGRYADGQLRTLQRRIKRWRALEGPPKEVFFPQEHHPGELCQSDFTSMNELRITINRERFDHLLYHFVLPYSNWESGMICFSESFESLSSGLQKALWELGGVPKAHQTDRLSAAVHKDLNPEVFTQRYGALLRHYRIEGRHIQTGQAHENGDVEQLHYRFKRALDQTLMLRGSRDFNSRTEYETCLRKLFNQLNSGRRERLAEELKVLGRLPDGRLEACKQLRVKVGSGSTIRVNHNVYSVDSRLIGEQVDVRLYGDYLDVWYAQRCIERIPRLRGEGKHHIQYRHIIDTLVRKPGAFENYRYRHDLFPTHRFRMAYDQLKHAQPQRAGRIYLQILHLAARENEAAVDSALGRLLHDGLPVTLQAVTELLQTAQRVSLPTEVRIEAVDVRAYDALLSERVVVG